MVKRISHKMDMIFTHFGISGPALRCSQFVYKEQKPKDKINMQLDVFPEYKNHVLEKK